MTNYAADAISNPVPTVVNQRTGTAAADAVPSSSFVLWRNSGAGTHTVTITTNNTAAGGLTIQDLSFTIAAGAVKGGPILAEWGDVNGFCAVAIDGTAAEVLYYVLGGV